MPKIHASTTIGAPPGEVFAYAADYRHATALVPGLTRFEPLGDRTDGEGAEFAAVFELGPKRYETTLAVVVFDPDRAIGWSSRSGAGQSLIWTFEPAGDGTAVDFELGFDLPGGIAGNLLSLTVEPLLHGRARDTAAALKRQVEATRGRPDGGAPGR